MCLYIWVRLLPLHLKKFVSKSRPSCVHVHGRIPGKSKTCNYYSYSYMQRLDLTSILSFPKGSHTRHSDFYLNIVIKCQSNFRLQSIHYARVRLCISSMEKNFSKTLMLCSSLTNSGSPEVHGHAGKCLSKIPQRGAGDAVQWESTCPALRGPSSLKTTSNTKQKNLCRVCLS